MSIGYATGTQDGGCTCPTCNGTGINPVASYMLCPKCNGEKRIPIARPRLYRKDNRA